MMQSAYGTPRSAGLVLVLVLGSAGAPALAEPIGRQLAIDPSPQGSQGYPSVSGLASGGWVAVWRSAKDEFESRGEIYGQRYDAADHRVGEEFHVDTSRRGDGTTPVVAGLTKGGFVVAWASGTHGQPDGIFGRHYSAAGRPRGDEFRINTYRPHAQLQPAIAALDDGGFVVVWISRDQNDHRYGVFGQRFDRHGARVGSEFDIGTRARVYPGAPGLSGLKGGGFVVAWSSFKQAGAPGWGAYGRLFDPTGTPIGDEFPVDPDTGDLASIPSVSGLKSGGFVIGWVTKEGSLYGRRFDSTAQAIGEPFLVTTGKYFDDIASAGLKDGGFVLMWTNWVDVDFVRGRRYVADGTSLGPRFRITSRPPIFPLDASVAGLKDGGFVAAWSDEESRKESDRDVYARRFVAD